MTGGRLSRAFGLFAECTSYPGKHLRFARPALRRTLALHAMVVFTWSFGQPYLQKLMVDAITTGKLLLLSAEVLGAVVLYAGMHSLSFAVAKRSARLRGLVKVVLTDRAVRALNGYSPGSRRGALDRITSRLTDEPAQLAMLVQFQLEMVGILLSSVFSIILCLIVSRYALIPFLMIAPVIVPISMIKAGKTRAAAHRAQQQTTRYVGVVSSLTLAVELIAPFRLVSAARRLIHREVATQQSAAYQLTSVQADSGRRTRIAMMIVELVIFLAAGIFVVRTSASLGSFFALIAGYAHLADAMKSLAERAPNVIASSAQIRRFERFINRAPSAWSDAATGMNASSGIDVDNVVLALGPSRQSTPIHFSQGQGEAVAIIGPNGAGKTTLARVIAGICEPLAGSAIVARPISVAFSPPIFPSMRVTELLRLEKRTDREIERLLCMAEILRLGGRFDDIPMGWSDGEKRRLSVLLALSKPARTYIFDEPCSGLDEASKATVMDLIRRETRGANLVVVLHEIAMAGTFDSVIDLSGPPPSFLTDDLPLRKQTAF